MVPTLGTAQAEGSPLSSRLRSKPNAGGLAGKYAALDAEAIPPLMQLLSSAKSKVRLNATKALTMLAEAPEGRAYLQSHVHVFRVLEAEQNEAIKRAAQIAIKVIEWKP